MAYTLRAEGHDAREDGTGRGVPLVFDERNVTSAANRSACRPGDPLPTMHASPMAVCLRSNQTGANGIGVQDDKAYSVSAGGGPDAVAFQTRIARNGSGQPKEVTDALTSCEGGTHADSKPHVAYSGGVRRLMPVECCRLQGFPDDWLEGLGLSDSAMYRMLGNAVAVPVAEWLGRRIVALESLT